MSYYKVKSVVFDKKNGKIFVTAADSSCRPRSYFRSEYASGISDFKEKCKQFWVSVLDGNMQFLKSCHWSEETDEYSCAMKSHFRKSGNQMSGKWKSSHASLLA